MIPRAYQPHAAFVAPARGVNQIPKLIGGVFMVEFLFSYGQPLIGKAIGFAAPGLGNSYFKGDTAAGMILQLLSFTLLTASVVFVLRRQHHRSLLSAIGDPIAATQSLVAVFLGVILLQLTLEILPPWWSLSAIAESRHLILWALTIPFALIALLVQTSAEEIFFRGYIQQQVAARFSNPVIWMILPNLLFAAAHWSNGVSLVDKWQYVIWAFCFGLAASDLTARTGNLGAAIGLHLANNVFAFMLVGELNGQDSGLALLLFPEVTGQPGGADQTGPIFTLILFMDLCLIWLAWLAARIAIRR